LTVILKRALAVFWPHAHMHCNVECSPHFDHKSQSHHRTLICSFLTSISRRFAVRRPQSAVRQLRCSAFLQLCFALFCCAWLPLLRQLSLSVAPKSRPCPCLRVAVFPNPSTQYPTALSSRHSCRLQTDCRL
jgi:hypothetical protein